MEAFSANLNIGSIRYGVSGASGTVSPVKLGGYHGGLRIIKREFCVPICSPMTWAGATPISALIEAQGREVAEIGVGLWDLNIKYPELSAEYKEKLWQR